ncbi:MAG TPA: T9SS type A sorting domain-containing protein [Bacteroidia bacterium]|nr:T9SS type A sorting domain-containing protein [Bacteroidia bacterium]HNT80182.1 T9SS type A sorting domain-containing protein [Bacteroidia bacterium]
MKQYLYLLFFIIFSNGIDAQILKPSIGLFSNPLLSDSICSIPIYTGSYDNSGLQKGDTVYDFTLYDINGDSINLKNELQAGKPILLIAGSYTCPVYRGKVQKINQIDSIYGNQLEVFVVYTVEAHPDIDVSPYSGTVWTTAQNQTLGILYQQPKTYGERINVVSDMMANMVHQVPVLIDGPCNEWWSVFGPAPNNAYLIDTNGIVFAKHGWFDKAPNNIVCDIDSLLGIGSCGPTAGNGTFTVQYNGSNTVTGNAGDILYSYANIINNSNGAADIMIIRYQNNIPSGWNTAMCVDICLPTWIDTTFLTLAPQSTQPFTMYFYTDTIPGQGMTNIRFINQNVTGNNTQKSFYASTLSTGIESLEENCIVSVGPNPFANKISFINECGSAIKQVTLYDISGRILASISGEKIESIDTFQLKRGIYFITASFSDNRERQFKVLKI